MESINQLINRNREREERERERITSFFLVISLGSQDFFEQSFIMEFGKPLMKFHSSLPTAINYIQF